MEHRTQSTFHFLFTLQLTMKMKFLPVLGCISFPPKSFLTIIATKITLYQNEIHYFNLQYSVVDKY